MKTYSSFVLSVFLCLGATSQALAVHPSGNPLLEITTNQALLSAQTRLNGPYAPERGTGRRDFRDTTHSNPVNSQL